MVSFSSTIEVGETPALAQDRARHLLTQGKHYDCGGHGHGGNNDDEHYDCNGHGGKNEDVHYKERLNMAIYWTIGHGGGNGDNAKEEDRDS